MKIKKHGFLLFLIIISSMWLYFTMPAPALDKQPSVYSIKVEGTVTEGTLTRNIQRGLRLAEQNQVDAALIILNTPGGLVSATLDILQSMSASNIPVITYVNPPGGIAASAV
ncbi:MAG: ATP-dependent Clp protease proteolytic subunit [Candidatus Syntrophopropionicum ammoniitolerans]